LNWSYEAVVLVRSKEGRRRRRSVKKKKKKREKVARFFLQRSHDFFSFFFLFSDWSVFLVIAMVISGVWVMGK